MDSAPWWFAGAAGLVGIVLGAVLKWIFDLLSERQKRRYEASSRFTPEKKEAYQQFMRAIDRAAISKINSSTNESILHGRRREDELWNAHGAPSDEEKVEMRAFIESEMELMQTAVREAQEALKAMQTISPAVISEYADKCLRSLLNGNRNEFEIAERAFLVAARQDLGVPTPMPTDPIDTQVDSSSGWIRLAPNLPWPSAPGKRYPVAIALRKRNIEDSIMRRSERQSSSPLPWRDRRP